MKAKQRFEVFVSGKQIVENGMSSIDKQSIFDEAIEISERLKRDAKSAVNEAEKIHPNIKSMVNRVHAQNAALAELLEFNLNELAIGSKLISKKDQTVCLYLMF